MQLSPRVKTSLLAFLVLAFVVGLLFMPYRTVTVISTTVQGINTVVTFKRPNGEVAVSIMNTKDYNKGWTYRESPFLTMLKPSKITLFAINQPMCYTLFALWLLIAVGLLGGIVKHVLALRAMHATATVSKAMSPAKSPLKETELTSSSGSESESGSGSESGSDSDKDKGDKGKDNKGKKAGKGKGGKGGKKGKQGKVGGSKKTKPRQKSVTRR